MATQWISPTWRMPENNNQSKVDNYSLDFDHTITNKIVCGDAVAYNTVTLSAWANPSSPVSYAAIFGSRNGAGDFAYLLSTDNTDKFRFTVDDGSSKSIYSDSTFSNDTWYHIVCVADGTNIKMYVNGTLQADTDTYGTLVTPSDKLMIGAQYEADTQYEWSGKIGQCCLYDTALSASQITALYNSGTPVNPMALTPLPVNYYPLGGGSTGDAADPATTLTVPNESVPSATVFDFDASDYIEVPQINTTGALSISAWVKTTDANYNMIYNEDEALRSGGNRNLFYSTVGAVLRLNLRFDSGGSVTVNTSGVTLNDGNWHNVSAVWNGTTDANEIKLFVDGILRGQGTAVEAVRKNFSMLGNIGGQNVTYDFDGQISNVQTYTTGLSYGSASSLGDVAGGEIATLYNNGVPLSTGTQPEAANLKGWWKMNVDTSTWNGTEWLLSNSGITPTYTTAVELPNSFQNPPAAWPGLTRSDTSWSGTDITLSFWVRYPNGYDGLIDYIRASGISIGSITSTNIQFGSGGTYRNFAIGNLQNTAWHNVVVYIPNSSPTFLISDVRCWIDGSEIAGTNIGSGTASQITTISGWGANSSVGTSNLSNWTLFNSDLTGSISTLYNGGTPADVSSLNPVSWYKCDSTNVTFPSPPGTSITFTDSSSNSNNATGAYDGDGIGGPFPSMTTTNVQAGDGLSFGMTTANLVTSDLTRSIPYSSYSMVFDGDDWATTGISLNTLSVTTSFSVSFWVNISVNTAFDNIISAPTNNTVWDSGFGVYVNGTGITFWVEQYNGTNQFVETAALNNDQWYNVIATFDTTNGLKLYVDGSTLTTASGTTIDGLTNNIFIGAAAADSLRSFNGNINNIAIWNSELSQDQILTIYNGGVPNDISSLSPVSWWSLAGDSYYDGTDFILPDISTNSNNATTANMAGTELVGDGPGSTANGVATSMDIPANLKGNAPNSTSNAFSVNMTAIDRVTSVPG